MVEESSLEDYAVSCSGVQKALRQRETVKVSLQGIIYPETVPGIQDLYFLIEGASKTLPEGTTKVHSGFVITERWNSVEDVIHSAIQYMIDNKDAKSIDIGCHEEELRAIIASPNNYHTRANIETLSIGADHFHSVYGLLQFYLVPKN